MQMLPNLEVEAGEADSSSSESTQQWFDTFSLSEDPAAAAQARALVGHQSFLHSVALLSPPHG